jgi:tRNA(fMet)-specific endonuclease VapC
MGCVIAEPGGMPPGESRYLLDTNVLSEPIRKKPDATVVAKLREHGGELATASIVWHEMTLGSSC